MTNTFEDAFGPLSHHLFPDGCPDQSLAAVWPHPMTRTRRATPTVTSSALALESLDHLRIYAKQHGLTSDELSAVAWVSHQMATATDLASVLVKNEHHFKTVVRCLLPKTQRSFTRAVVSRLLSIHFTKGRVGVLRFLTLAIQTGDWLELDAMMLLTNSQVYAGIFQSALQPACCADAVSLLLRLTCAKHATKRCIRRMEIALVRYADKVKPLTLLLSLMQCLNNDSTKYVAATNVSLLTNTPDKQWVQDFATRTIAQEPLRKKVQSTLTDTLSKPLAYSGRLVDLLSNQDIQRSILLSKTEQRRLQAILAEGLHEEWFVESLADEGGVLSTQNQSRLELLSALNLFVERTDWLLSDVEQFVVNTVLSNWDGTELPFGSILCRGLIPRLRPFQPCELLDYGALYLLAPHFLYGTTAQRTMVMAAFIGVVNRWSRLALIAVESADEEGAGSNKIDVNLAETIDSLINYVEDLCLTALLLEKRENEGLRMLILDFYEAVFAAWDTRPNISMSKINFAIVQRLILSPSAIILERFCHLLTKVALKESTSFVIAQDEQHVANSFPFDAAVSHALWPSANQKPTSSLFDEVSEETRQAMSFGVDEEVPNAVNIVNSVAFAGYALGFIKERPGNGLPNTSTSVILADMCEGNLPDYLEYLRRQGFSGIPSLWHHHNGNLQTLDPSVRHTAAL
ncbi:hypothetical protein MPSEU_000343800 [Mayamaea pseudoterrestris]|nr:hypothetical protein MPSEU_000343800 [Mayamaea pseudoterrestris]